MTKEDFFALIIKILGLYLIISTLFSGIASSLYWSFVNNKGILVLWVILAILSVVVLVSLFVILVFKADKVVKILKLDIGFEDNRIDFGNLKGEDIVKIGSFIIGGILFINNIPSFLSLIFIAFKNSFGSSISQLSSHNHYDLIVSGINIVLGYLLITKYSYVAKLFLKRSKNKAE